MVQTEKTETSLSFKKATNSFYVNIFIMFRYVFIIVLACTPFFGQAQSVKISGVVLDSIQETIPGATVMLVGQQDSLLKTFAISDPSGRFKLLQVPPGNYDLKISYFGYDPYSASLTIPENVRDTLLPPIKLSIRTLDEVVVAANYIPIQIKGDTIEYDPRAFETDEHDAVEELLRQLPGVEVDAEGNIKAQGRNVGKILIDGEEFFTDDPKLASKNLPADAIEKVQVYDKGSDLSEFTGIDDGEEITTINLKLKSSHKQGAFGNIHLEGGSDLPLESGQRFADHYRYFGKGNIHYFRDKWQASAIGLSNNVNQTGFTIDDYINFVGGISKFIEGGVGAGGIGAGLPLQGNNNNGFLQTSATGLNFRYKPSNRTVLSGNGFLNSFQNNYLRDTYRETSYTDSTLVSTEDLTRRAHQLNNSYNLSFEHTLDSTQELDLNGSFAWGNSRLTNAVHQSNFNASDSLSSQFDTDQNSDQTSYDYSVSGRYRKKFKKMGQFTGGGISYSASNSDNATQLSYLSKLYASGLVQTFPTDQVQDGILNDGTLTANWLWSHALHRKHLLQFDVDHQRKHSSRDRNVRDVVNGSNFLNDFYSGAADYTTYRNTAGARHKFFKKKLKTTIGADYQFVQLAGQRDLNVFRSFQYVYPQARLKWTPKKSTTFELNYDTYTTLPTLNQLQALPSNVNPAEIINGNTQLIPEYTHQLGGEFNRFNQFNFTHIFLILNAYHTRNKIAFAQDFNPFLVREITPKNLGTENSADAYLNVGSSLYPIKTKFAITWTSRVARGNMEINGIQDSYTNLYTQPSITLDNIKKKVINVQSGFKYTWSQNTYKTNSAFNNQFMNWNYFAKVKVSLKKRVLVSIDVNHYFFPQLEANSQQFIMNAQVAVNLLKSRRLRFYVAGYDLLKQRRGIQQNFAQNIYEEVVTSTLSRYATVGVKYSFNKFGAVK